MSQPEITIATPLTSRSGKWEPSVDGQSAGLYDDFWMMVDFLAAKFGEIESDTDNPRAG